MSKHRLPTELRMFGFLVRVYSSEKPPRWADPGRFGCIHTEFDPPRIWVSTAWPWEDQRSTLLHEIIHLAFAARQITFPTEEAEDFVVFRVEHALDDVLCRNEELVRLWLPEE